MSNAKEIRTRINSIQDTAKITNAMYLISSTKMQKARKNMERTMPYFDVVRNEAERIFSTMENADSRYFFSKNPEKNAEQRAEKNIACLVITADKGLAGSYNSNVIKETERLLERHPDARLYVIGDYGRHHFERHGIPFIKSFTYTAQTPTMQEARDIAKILIDSYNAGEIDALYCIYTVMENALTCAPKRTRIIPFERSQFYRSKYDNEQERKKKFEFYPSADAVLDVALKSLISGFIYGALVTSFCSEQDARMTAMDSANKNADKILDSLRLKYNRVRQAAITQEITEIASGEMAQKRKTLKKKAKEARTS